MNIIISNTAKTGIMEIYNYIAKDSLKYANETVYNLYSLIDYLKLSPYLGRYVPEIEDKRFREVLHKSYRIVYSISKQNIIYIHFVIHGKRNLKSFFNSYISKNNI